MSHNGQGRSVRPRRGAPPLRGLLWTGVPVVVGQHVNMLVAEDDEDSSDGPSSGVSGESDEGGGGPVWRLGCISLITAVAVQVCLGADPATCLWYAWFKLSDVLETLLPITTNVHQVERTVGSVRSNKLDGAIVDYRSPAFTARRDAARVTAEGVALARAAIWHTLVLGTLAVQLAVMDGRFDSRAILIEMYSGPFRSMSNALQRGFDRVATVTVDWNARFNPDVRADLRVWNLWAWLIRHGAFWTVDGRLWLPACLHFSPSCGTWARASWFHGRSVQSPGGFADDFISQAANDCAFAICFLLAQVASEHLPISYCVENPAGSLLWSLPCMAALMARSNVLDVSYCVHGSGLEKRTRFVCSPTMRFPWAIPEAGVRRPACNEYFRYVCSGDGGCGRMVATASQGTLLAEGIDPCLKHNGKSGGFTIADAEIPLRLACRIHESWGASDNCSRARTPQVMQASLETISRLANDWAIQFNDGPGGAGVGGRCECSCDDCTPSIEVAAQALLALSRAPARIVPGREACSPAAPDAETSVVLPELPPAVGALATVLAVAASSTAHDTMVVARLVRPPPSTSASAGSEAVSSPTPAWAVSTTPLTSSSSSDSEESDSAGAAPVRPRPGRRRRGCARCTVAGVLYLVEGKAYCRDCAGGM